MSSRTNFASKDFELRDFISKKVGPHPRSVDLQIRLFQRRLRPPRRLARNSLCWRLTRLKENYTRKSTLGSVSGLYRSAFRCRTRSLRSEDHLKVRGRHPHLYKARRFRDRREGERGTTRTRTFRFTFGVDQVLEQKKAPF